MDAVVIVGSRLKLGAEMFFGALVLVFLDSDALLGLSPVAPSRMSSWHTLCRQSFPWQLRAEARLLSWAKTHPPKAVLGSGPLLPEAGPGKGYHLPRLGRRKGYCPSGHGQSRNHAP